MARLTTLTCRWRGQQQRVSLTLKGSYQRHFPRCRPGRYSSPMPATTTKHKYRCMQCEMTEDRCQCERYCCLCQAQMEIRLCQDGLFYCEPCRDACEYKASD